MLSQFIALNREAIIAQTRERLQGRPWPSVSPYELEHGVPLFLTQLTETLQLEAVEGLPLETDAISLSAQRHGADLIRLGFTVSQVVHDYGDICQAITEIAVRQQAPITVEEFQTLNRCLDVAIAGAVTEHARLTASARSAEDVGRLAHAAHELRDMLNTALLGFHALRRGTVAINGSTGAVLGRSLMEMRDAINRTLSEVRLDAGAHRPYRVKVANFIDEISAAAVLHAEYRGVEFAVSPVDPGLEIDGDPPLLTSAVMNLLHNAFKHTPPGGHVTLKADAGSGRLSVEVADECGGIPEGKQDLFEAFGERRGADRSGLGLGLSIARRAAQAHGGEISVTNFPGLGCIFRLEMPLAAERSRSGA